MKNLWECVISSVRLALFLAIALGGSALAQSVDPKEADTMTAAALKAAQAVQPQGTEPAILSAKAGGTGTTRIPFQRRVIVTPLGTAFQTQFLPIPAGKRLVIENISAIARNAEGQRMEMNFFTYMDNGDGQGGIAAITFHRIVLTDQGVFDGVSISSANHKVLVFADERIGTQHYQIGFSARLNGPPTGFPQAQVTFSGYLEDLPATQTP